MKSIMRRSLAIVMAMAMLLSVLVVPAFAETEHVHTKDNTPCIHAGTEAVKTEKVEPTCQVNGGIWHTCTECGDVWVTDEVAKDPDNHKWSTTAVAKDPTCFSEGYTATIVCENEDCDAKQGGTIIPKRTHTVKSSANPNGCLVLNTEKTTLQDCINGGKVEYMCEFKDAPAENGVKCDYNPAADTENNGEVPPSGHRHELVTTEYQAPTCAAEGWVKLHCTVCQEIVEVVARPNPHSWVEVPEEPSTCLVPGYHKGGYCDAWWLVWDENGNATKVTCGAYYLGTDTDTVYVDDTVQDKESLRHDATTQHDFTVKAEGANGEVITMPNGELSYKEAKCDPNLTAEEQGGWQYYYCSKDCGVYEKRDLTAEHVRDTDITETRKNPTCTEDGYIKYTCKNCGELYLAETLYAAHKFAGQTSATHKIVYIFVKNNAVYVNDGVADEPLVLNNVAYNLTVRPYITEDLTDAKAVELLAEGYTATEWIEIDEADCGVMGTYVQYCTVCGQGFFLTVMTVHQWDGNAPTRVDPTCTTPGGYWGICSVCSKGYFLGQADDEQYNGEEAPLQHKKHDGSSAGMTGSTFNVPHAAEQPSSCIELGWNAFDYCDRDDCALPTYEEAKRAAMKTDYAPHSYFDPQDNALNPVTVNPTCKYRGFQIAACAVDGCDMVYNLDPAVNGGDTIAYNHRILGTESGQFDGISHVYPDFGEAGRPVDYEATCATPGRYADVQCTLCSWFDQGQPIPVLDPGEAPSYTAGMVTGLVGNWFVTVTDAVCTTPGSVIAECNYCKNNGTTTHAPVDITPETGFGATGDHFIKDATYLVDSEGKPVKFMGAFIVVGSTLKNAVASARPADFVVNAGNCSEDMNDLHADYYECRDCGDVIAFSVRLDHTKPTTPPACGQPEKCVDCQKVLTPAVPHNMVRVDPEEVVNDDTNCATEFYYHIECTECGFGSKSAGFEWTDEWKLIAGYIAAKTHTYNVENVTCLIDKHCINQGCTYVAEEALGHADTRVTKTPTDPTCIAKGFWTVKCPAGELCDKFIDGSATLVEEGGVKYATWTEVDDASATAPHRFVDYISQTRTCLTFGVLVQVCQDCKLTEQATYQALNLKDPTGHKLVDDNTIEDCDEGGCYWQNCEYCFDEAKYNAGEKGMWNEKDWKGEIGYTDKTFEDPTGHWYWSTPAEGATQEEIDAFVKEKIFFDLTCVDLTAHKNPTCADCGVQFIAEKYHNISKEYTLAPTCTTSGLSWKYCTNDGCGYKDILKVESALGHNNLYWRTTTAATCCAEGTAVLACHDCNADVKAGELILKGTALVAATAADLTKSLDKVAHVMVKDEEKSIPQTIHQAGKLVKKCVSTTHACEYTESEDLGKLDIVEFTATIDNAVKPGHMVFVNGGKIAYTIFIDGEDKTLYGLNFDVKYDAAKLTFTGFDLGVDNANIFGTLDPSGACNTWVGGTVILTADGLDGIVSVLATASPVDNKIGSVELDEKQEFVTLYFDINADSVTDAPTDGGYSTDIVIQNVALEDENSDNDFDNDYNETIVESDVIFVGKLGDANVVKDDEGNTIKSDNILNVRDVHAIEALILSKTYDARADINQDGFITSADLLAVQRYIVKSHTYAEMVGVE